MIFSLSDPLSIFNPVEHIGLRKRICAHNNNVYFAYIQGILHDLENNNYFFFFDIWYLCNSLL